MGRLRGCVVLVLLSHILFSEGNIIAYDDNGVATNLEDVPSMRDFGPRIPSTGFTGRLQLVAGFGCSVDDYANARAPTTSSGDQHAENNSEEEAEYDLPVAALVSRSLPDDPHKCTFEKKVLNAQENGVGLVVVYDYKEEGLFHMQREVGVPRPPVLTPSVLVSRGAGLKLQAIIESSSDPVGPKIFVDRDDPFHNIFISLNLTMVMVISGFLLIMVTCGSLVLGTLHSYLRQYDSLGGQNRPLSLPEALRLSEVVVEAGSRLDGESCSVCLDPFVEGEKLRSLSCCHAFHQECILPWLTERQRTCPMCKARVEPGQPSTSSLSRGTTRFFPPTPTPLPLASPQAVPAPQAAHTGMSINTTNDATNSTDSGNPGTRGGNGVGGGAGEGGQASVNERHPLLSNAWGPGGGGGRNGYASYVDSEGWVPPI
ncbi:unnamed protein product [Discosporangium mesarthrocarpum]